MENIVSKSGQNLDLKRWRRYTYLSAVAGQKRDKIGQFLKIKILEINKLEVEKVLGSIPFSPQTYSHISLFIKNT